MFRPIAQNLSLRDQIVQGILAKIEEGTLTVGDRLPTERDLAIAFNVSRTTVRDALRTLVGLGVLSIQHGKGIFIQGDEGIAMGNALWAPLVVKPDTVAALFEVRKTLETAAAGWAAVRAPLAQREELVALVHDVKGHVTSAGLADFGAAALSDQAFHTALIIASGNPIAGRLMTNLLDLLQEVRQQSLAIPGRAWQSILDHEQIAEAILAGDAAAAAAAMMAHLSGVEQAVLGSLTSPP
ncbi:MAG: FCD domain-containing protein [Thermaerobacter sp.]|nr:FCD domain-containing protein [Thermaerobacter sp.]